MINIKLTQDNLSNSGPRMNKLFGSDDASFHIRKIGTTFELTRFTKTKVSHIIKIEEDDLTTMYVEPVHNPKNQKWELEIEGGNLLDLLQTITVYNNEIPFYSDVVSSCRKTNGAPMNKDSILKLVA